MNSPFTKITYTVTSSSSLKQFLRAVWGVFSLEIILILPQMKPDSQLSCCVFFKVDIFHNVYCSSISNGEEKPLRPKILLKLIVQILMLS